MPAPLKLWGQVNFGELGGPSVGRGPGSQRLSHEEAAKMDYSSGGIDIHVLGEVVSPGTYRINSGDRLLRALQLAGGVNLFSAENRIELRRKGKSSRTVSLVRLFREGMLDDNPYLQENDVVYVPRKVASARVQGTVQFPGLYEISVKEETSAWDLIQLSGGFTVGLAEGKKLTLIRYDETNRRQVLFIQNDEKELKSTFLKNGDTLHSPHKFTIDNEFDNSVLNLPNDHIAYPTYTGEVFVLGGVKNPGKQEFIPHHSLGKYIALSGGLSRLGRTDLVVYGMNGKVVNASMNSPIQVNPGDTIVVGESKLGPEFYVTLMTTIAGLALTSIAIFK